MMLLPGSDNPRHLSGGYRLEAQHCCASHQHGLEIVPKSPHELSDLHNDTQVEPKWHAEWSNYRHAILNFHFEPRCSHSAAEAQSWSIWDHRKYPRRKVATTAQSRLEVLEHSWHAGNLDTGFSTASFSRKPASWFEDGGGVHQDMKKLVRSTKKVALQMLGWTRGEIQSIVVLHQIIAVVIHRWGTRRLSTDKVVNSPFTKKLSNTLDLPKRT